MRTYLVRTLALAVLMLIAAVVEGAEAPALARARTLYNAADFEGAIDAASVARRDPQSADAAALVIARARLERYRQTASASELADAREALRSVKSAALSARDQVDLLIGLGQALYLGEIFGPAAELFDTAIDKADLLSVKERGLLLDWWATAVDRDAQLRPYDRRTSAYQRIGERMERALHADPSNAVANYWQVVASRGVGDLDRAWSAAIAAWVRSTLDPVSSAQLRDDLDRLVAQALIPERARSGPAREGPELVETLRAEWELVKANWK
jgi:hypothetical protein